MTLARVLDGAALAVGAAFLSTLVVWWARPEDLFLTLLGVGAVRLLVAPVSPPAVGPRHVLGLGMAAYAIGFSFLTVTRHLAFRTHALDLGYYTQLTWNLARGHGPRVSLPEMHAWGDHLSPVMYLFVPLFWLAPGAVGLLIAQSAALALGALPVYAIARQRVGSERVAAAFALLYLANPSLHGVNVRDFHAAALAIPLLLTAIYAAGAERWGLFAAATVVTLACREDAALAVIGLGAWIGLGRRRWIPALLTSGTALAVLLVDVWWVIPWFRGEAYPHLARYTHLGSSLGSVLAALFLHPVAALAPALTLDRLVYLLALLAPVGFLPLRAPADLLGAAPALVQNLLAADPILHNYRTQYQAFVLPFVIAAAVAGCARAARRAARPPRAVLVVAMVASLALSARTVNDLAVARWWPAGPWHDAYAVLPRVPPGAAVSAQDPYVAHLSLRPLVFVFPMGIEQSDYVLLNTATYPWRNLPGTRMTREGPIVTIELPGGRSHRYTVAAEAGPHLLLRREGTAGSAPHPRA